jgi:SET domain-containing protein
MRGLSSKLQSGRSSFAGCGLFAREPVFKDEVILDLSGGEEVVITAKEAAQRYEEGFDYMIQADDDRFVVTVPQQSFIERGYINHSCDPNCGLKSAQQLVAMRAIEIGEEITFDYAMSESSDYEIACKCGSAFCRGLITGNDWKIPELQKRYRNYFSPYLQKKINSGTP